MQIATKKIIKSSIPGSKISLRARQRAALGNCIAELKLRCSRCNSWILSISLCVEMTMGFWYLRAFGPHPQLHIWNQMTLLNKSIIAKQSSFFFLFYLHKMSRALRLRDIGVLFDPQMEWLCQCAGAPRQRWLTAKIALRDDSLNCKIWKEKLIIN